MNNRYANPMIVRPSGYAASNLIPWPAVTSNRPAIAYYQRVLNEYLGLTARLNEGGVWGPLTQRVVAQYQVQFNSAADRSGPTDIFSKYGLSRLRTDGVLDESTQTALQVNGQRINIPRGNFPVGVVVDRPTNNYVGGGADTTQTHFAMEPARTPTNTPSPATQPAVATFPWGTVATVGGIALLIGFGAWAVSATKDNR